MKESKQKSMEEKERSWNINGFHGLAKILYRAILVCQQWLYFFGTEDLRTAKSIFSSCCQEISNKGSKKVCSVLCWHVVHAILEFIMQFIVWKLCLDFFQTAWKLEDFRKFVYPCVVEGGRVRALDFRNWWFSVRKMFWQLKKKVPTLSYSIVLIRLRGI